MLCRFITHKPEKRRLYSEWATGWTVLGSNTRRGNIFFCSTKLLNILWSPPSLTGLKRLWRDVDQQLPCSNEGTNKWSCTFTPLQYFNAWTGATLPLPLHFAI